MAASVKVAVIAINANEVEWRVCWVVADSAFDGSQSVLCWCAWQECGLNRREYVFIFNLLNRQFINVIFSLRFTKINVQ
jgi:hypothetical protein